MERLYNMWKLSWILILQLLLIASLSYSEEGMWLPNDLPEDIIKDMQAKGLELNAKQLYNENGTGIVNAVVSLGGGTGSFVSPAGLIITNHHVAYRAVQRLSTAENNYIEKGFLAKTKSEEQPAYGYNAYVILSIKDVTKPVLSKVTDDMSPLERYNAIEKRTKEIVKKAEAGKDVYCAVRNIFSGQKYYLYTYKKIKDIRVVYVPPRSIGEFGGDIDNWMWPRHTGDFSFLRAYIGPEGKTAEYSKDNVPYKPKSYLQIAKQGLKEGDFALIAGYPGRTQRYMTSYGIDNQQNFRLPRRIDLYSRWINILEKASKNDPDAVVKVAGTSKALNNAMKYYQGLMDGFLKFNLLEEKRQKEKDFTHFLKNNKKAKVKFGEVLPKIKALYDGYKTYRLKSDILGYLRRVRFLGFATTLYKWSLEKQKNDMERDPAYMERRVPSLKRGLKIAQKTLHPASDQEVMKMFLYIAADLPEDQRIQALDGWLGGKSGAELDAAITAMLDELYGNTKLGDAETRLKMFDMSHEELMKQNDPFISLAEKLYPENEKLQKRYKTFSGSLTKIMPKWIDGLRAWKKGALYADANATMRINYGVVKGYSPRDAVWHLPFTTLAGVMEKDTGEEPFDVPEGLRQLYAAKDLGEYADEQLKDVPIDLLTTNDSTGGNSGSPLLNGKGELVGLLFDGNYEAMSADYEFNEALTRSINVDIRYVLFVSDKVNKAQNVLKEMGVE